MKTFVKVAIGFVLGFLGGGASGYFFCKSQETKFVVCTDEEQLAAAEADFKASQSPENVSKSLSDKVNEIFDTKPEEAVKETVETQTMAQINTQKTQYWKKFQDEGGKYDRHDELEEGEEPVTSDEEFDPGFMNEIQEEGEVSEEIPDVEESDLQEFYHWSSIPDGEYDTISVEWYAGDGVLTDDEGAEIKEPIKFLGFDPKEAFEGKRAPDEDPDAVYRKNNKFKTIFEVIRYNATYSVKRRMEEFGGDE